MEPVFNMPEKVTYKIPQYIIDRSEFIGRNRHEPPSEGLAGVKGHVKYDPFFDVVIPEYIDTSRPFVLVDVTSSKLLQGGDTFSVDYRIFKVMRDEYF